MKQKEIDTIKKLLSSSCRGDHMVGLALLTKNRSVKRLTRFFDNYGSIPCLTVDYLSKTAWELNKVGRYYRILYHYEAKEYGFYVGDKVVYLVKPNHPHKKSWNSINI